MSRIEHAELWSGDFGDSYTARNQPTEKSLASRIRLFQRVLRSAPVEAGATVLEVGTNIGMNLVALARLAPLSLFGVDLNRAALTILCRDPALGRRARVAVAQAEQLPFANASMDLVFTCGLLIHIHPDHLLAACREILRVARRYILCAEYFSPRPEEIEYRGQYELLFKRDFGGFFLDHWPTLRLLDYGFLWKRLEFDDVTWWLFARPEGMAP